MRQDYELTKHVLREMHGMNERNEVVAAGAAMAIESIDLLLQQRAELLEALKGMKDAFCNPESGEMDKRLAIRDMNIAITSAEAAE